MNVSEAMTSSKSVSDTDFNMSVCSELIDLRFGEGRV